MKKLFLTIALLISTGHLFAQSIKTFKWLEGKWQRQNDRPGTVTYEFWELKKDYLIGMGFTLKEKDTVFVERLKIAKKDDVWNYIVDTPQNPSPVSFKITSFDKMKSVWENESHDFPKKISYIRDDKNSMTATISGDGKVIPFVFVRTD